MRPTYITTSWDDGNEADLRVAEMLSRHGLAGTFYVPRSIDSGVMSVPQLRELASRFEIGAHTLNHVFLTDVDDPTAKREIEGSRKWVQDQTGQPCPMFCPPAGRFKSRHWRMFRDAGYAGVRTVEFMSFSPPRLRGGILEMPTTMQAFPHPRVNYLKNLTKRLAVASLWRYTIVGHSTDWPSLAQKLLDRVLRTGGVFHLWGHSWEVEQTAQWGRLERVLSLLGEASRHRGAVCVTNGQVCERCSGAATGDPPQVAGAAAAAAR